MRGDPELNAMARRVIDANHYMTLATLDPDGRPRLSPVYYTAARYTDFYWVSSPEAHHSRNLAERPEVQIVIFDSTAPVGRGEAVYLRGVANQMADEELDLVLPEAFRIAAGARRLDADELRGGAPFRLYLASAAACEVRVAGGHPVRGRGVDTRQPADPASS